MAANPSRATLATAPAAPCAEAARQQALLAALWPGAADATPDGAGLSRDRAARPLSELLVASDTLPVARGLQAYRFNAGAVAERALGAAYPVLRAQLGAEAFASFARAFWQACPPARGDLATFGGDALAAFLAADPQLVDVPWLADLARLEATVARAESAADATLDAAARRASLQRLADTDPADLRLQLAPGAAVVASRWPIASLHAAHDVQGARDGPGPVPADPAALDAVRARIAAGDGEHAFTWRAGWRARVAAVDTATAAFLSACVAGRALAAALDAAGDPDFRFDTFLARALADEWLDGLFTLTP